MGNKHGTGQTRVRPTNRRRIDRFYNIVWCDSTIGDDKNHTDDTYTVLRLQRVVNQKRQLIHAFNDIEECKLFLNEIHNVCLIVSGRVGEILVPEVHRFDQILSVFVFCMNYQKNYEWARHYKKVCGVFTDIEQICDQLITYYYPQENSEYENLTFDLLRNSWETRQADQEDLCFFYSIFSQILLGTMNSSEETMLNYLIQEYSDENEKNLIDDLHENYSQKEAIYLFTKDRFYQEVVNQSFRMHDLCSLSSLNCFIRLINQQLTNLYNSRTNLNENLIVYVSHTISHNDFVRLEQNEGSIICFNEFLFGKSEKTLARLILEDQQNLSHNMGWKSVLFEIKINEKKIHNKFYAKIGSSSPFTHENEYLFSNGCLFLIDRVSKWENSANGIIVDLTFLEKQNPKVVSLMNFVRMNYLHENSEIERLGENVKNVLTRFKLNRFYLEMNLGFSRENIRIVLVHLNLAIIYTNSDRLDQAIKIFDEILKFLRDSISEISERRIFLAPIHGLKAQAHQNKKQETTAFNEAYNALTISLRRQNNSKISKNILASSHFNLALILEQQKRNSEAFAHYSEALKVFETFLPFNHPDLLQTKTSIERISSIQQNHHVDSSNSNSFLQTTAL